MLFNSPLPPYAGPYKVGTFDLEVAVPKETFGTALIKATGEPALVLETILVTIYYPASPLSKGTGTHQPWVERPISTTAQGYARFTGKSSWILRPLFWIFASGAHLPAYIAPALADKLAEDGRGAAAMAAGASEADDSFPVVIFSHGLGGTRTTYSQYCGELASHGNVVLAVESRDGSGPASLVHQDGGLKRTVLYLRSGDLAYGPHDPVLSQLDFRKEQLLMRAAEVKATLEVVRRLNAGEGAEVAKENRRCLTGAGGDVGLPLWKGRLSADATMAGHSFGGATTIQVLRAGKAFPFLRGVTLDPWVDAIPPVPSTPDEKTSEGDSAEKAGTDIDVPLLVINSEAFTLWQPHFATVRDIVGAVNAPAWFLTLVGTVHLSFSDLPLIQKFVGRRAGARIAATEAMNSFVATTLEFLSGHGKEGKILGRDVLPGDENPTRPGEGAGQPMQPDGELRLHFTPREV